MSALLPRVAPIAITLLLGCRASPAAFLAAPVSPVAPARAVALAPSAPAPAPPLPIPTTSPSASAAPLASALPPLEAPPPGPAPLTQDEQKEVDTKCRPLTQAIAARKGKGGGNPLDILHAIASKPPHMPAGDAARCSSLLERGIQTYLIAAKEVEATVVLNRLGRAMAMAYQASGTLCPSSERPIPANKTLVAPGPYVSAAGDWSTPAWKCLDVDLTGQPQRFQYEIRTVSKPAAFELVARGVPGDDGRWVELHQWGTVGAKGIVLGGVERQ